MRKDFFSSNSRSITIILIFVGLWVMVFVIGKWDNSVQRYINNPKKGQIYVFEEDNFFAPMRLDSVSENELFLRNYLFLFEDAIPKKSQISHSEFDTLFFAIYTKAEMIRLSEEGNLVHIYP